MITGDPELIAIMRAEISARGPMSFARFMQLALYDPLHGYYACGRAAIGRGGDFFTNVSVGPMFGQLLAIQFAEIWNKQEKPSDFLIVEQGAHDGAFAADAMVALERFSPACYGAIRYVIAEPFPAWQVRQRKTLAPFRDKIRWIESIQELEPFVGIHFSNELFDALPVHLVAARFVKGSMIWMEKLVTNVGEQFAFVFAPVTDADLQRRLNLLGLPAAEIETEVSLVALKLMREIAAKLSCGVILAIDYGFSRAEFYSPHRREGSLQIRSRHRKLSPFQGIGRADISAHVDWTSLSEAAFEAGAIPLGFTDQHHFLTGIVSGAPVAPEEAGASNTRALQTLLHPELLGRSFQVLGLAKNFAESLSGFRFAGNARINLGT